MLANKTKQDEHRTVTGARFLWLIFQHVLPKGFRRVRDYGFLHANAKKLLSLVQLVLHIVLKTTAGCPNNQRFSKRYFHR